MIWNRFEYVLGAVYFVTLVALGIIASRRDKGSNQFLNATGSLPLWMCIAACIAANCGSLDVIAMMGLGAQYGMLACHFYWIGAVPALIVVALWLLPAYARGRYPTVLDFIAHYYGERTRSVVALCMAAMMLLLAGVCLCAVAQTMEAFLGWSFASGILATTSVVLFYTWMGGLRATVYTELLHFSVVLLAIVPLFFLVIRDFGGIRSLVSRIPTTHLHAWQDLPAFAPGAPMDIVGVVFGLGIVLSFGFWATDFVQMQRALAVKRSSQVPFVPLSMAAAKMVFAFVVVLPGIVAPLVLGTQLQGHWNATLPGLMLHYFKPSWVAMGVMGLIASLVSTFANNVSGFSSAWVQGVYQAWLRPAESDAHYFRMGRVANVAAIVLAIGASYSALSYQSLMEYIQMILSTFNAPIFALVALAALVPRQAAGGGLIGLLTGLASAGVHQVLVFAGLLHYGSRMSANFYAAIFSFVVTAAATLLVARLARSTAANASSSEAPARVPVTYSAVTLGWAFVVAAACVAVNVWLR
jgi:SSS family solute:Na+ symporter